MQKRLFYPCLLAFAVLTGIMVHLGISEAQEQAPQQIAQADKIQNVKKLKYARGHVTRKDLKQLVAISIARHGRRLRSLPQATAPTFDCGQLGWVPPIVDQGQCGSCWDFSGTSVCTSAFMKALGTAAPGPLSEQYTLDCGQNGGCGGDDNITVLDWAKKTGLPTTASYGPYQASSGRCNSSPGTLYKIDDWGFCTTSDTNGVANIQDIKNSMVAFGPIGSGIDAGVLGDGTGIISGGGSNIDHDIVLVGWDDSKGTKGCWKLRNSWGTGWGNAGYCWIEYGSGSVGTEACWAMVKSPDPPPTPPVPPVPPVPPPPVPPTPGQPITITVTGTGTILDGTFELAKNGAGAIVADAIAKLQSTQMVPPMPPVPPSPVQLLERRVTALEDGVNRIINLLEGKK